MDERERIFNMSAYERELWGVGYKYVAGIDEAGRGPLAGPVYAAAVIFDEGVYIEGINDSKKLSEKKREMLFDEITKKAAAYAVCSVDEKTIDEINILEATFKAMNAAAQSLDIKPDYVLIDGNRMKNMQFPYMTIVKGDSKSISIAAASILAKVSRDREMCYIAKLYPEYGFDRHKGYGTKEHINAILKYGALDIHRRTFLKKIMEKQYENEKDR